MSHWQSKMVIRYSDRLMTQYIKLRDKGLCQVNFKCYKGTPGIDNSHFQKRRKETVRYDPENCDLVCRVCHNFIENDPEGQKALEKWKLNQLGETRYKALLVRANQIGKKDEVLAKLWVKGLIEELTK